MAVSLISVKCPECGAALSIEKGRAQAFCTYCGAKILINNENEYIVRHIDEADVMKAETEKLIRLKELEMEEKEREQERRDKDKRTKRIIIVALIWIVIEAAFFIMEYITDNSIYSGYAILFLSLGCLGAFYWFVRDRDRKEAEAETRLRKSGMAELDIDDELVKLKLYTVVEAEFRSLGFSNIQCFCLHDKRREGIVESITVGGARLEDLDERWFYPNVPIIITYHGK